MRLPSILTVALLVSCNSLENSIQTGDLLFVGGLRAPSDNGSMSEAIMDATGGNDINYTHAAILEVDEDGLIWVIDASPNRGVDRHPLDTLISDFTTKDGKTPYMEVMRLQDNSRAESYIANAMGFIGEDYDFYFLPDNGKHYCTELIEDSYIDNGEPVFKGKPMNFKNKDGEFPEYWKQLFSSLGQDIPQGVKGTNPQDMHDDPRLKKLDIRFSPSFRCDGSSPLQNP